MEEALRIKFEEIGREECIKTINRLVLGRDFEGDEFGDRHIKSILIMMDHIRFTVDERCNFLMKTVLPCQRYKLALAMLKDCSSLYQKVVKEISGCSIESCIRLLFIVICDDLPSSSNYKEKNYGSKYSRLLINIGDRLHGVLENEKREEFIQEMKEILVGLVRFVIVSRRSLSHSDAMLFLSLVPDFNVRARVPKKYCPCTSAVWQSTYDVGPTLLVTMILRGNKPLCKFLLDKGADLNLPTGLGTTPLMASSYKNNVLMYEMLIKYGANPYLSDNKGHTLDIYALRNQSTRILYIIEKSGYQYHFTQHWLDKIGYSRLMLWFMGRCYGAGPNVIASVFSWLIRNEGARTLEWLNKDGDSFMSLCRGFQEDLLEDDTGHKLIVDHIKLKIQQIRSKASGRWICPFDFNAKNALVVIAKKMHSVFIAKGLNEYESYDKLVIPYKDLEFIRLFSALAKRFPVYFPTLFHDQTWKNIMAYCDRSLRVLTHMLCRPLRQDKESENENNGLVKLSHDVLNHIFSYLPYALTGQRLDVVALQQQLVEDGSNLSQSKTVHWVALSDIVSFSSCDDQQDEEDNNLYYEHHLYIDYPNYDSDEDEGDSSDNSLDSGELFTELA